MNGNADLKALIREVADFPRPGISFKDVTTLLAVPGALCRAVEAMLAPFGGETIDRVVGIESRGFIFGAPMAMALGCAFVPVRKPGKLPAASVRQEYVLEYGADAVEMHEDGVRPGERLLMVDDLLATGGTMQAACQLVERLGGSIVGVSFLIELPDLKGRDRLGPHRVESVVAY